MADLAVNGGMPVKKTKFPEWPVYGQEELRALERVLKSGVWGTLGGEAAGITKRFSEYQHCRYGVAVTNGTVTLELILRALDIGYGDEVVLPPYTFYATASAVIMAGATPVFADIDLRTFNIDPEKLGEAITPRTKAVIAVHIGGRPCDMDRVMEIAGKYKLAVIEDAAHSHGSEWKGVRTGAMGIAGSFSFQASKNLCAGEGGMITTNNEEVFERCWSLHNCGRAAKGSIWYEHPNVGTNARMTEWQAAILDAQMNRMDEQIETRMRNAAYLDSLLGETGFIAAPPRDARVTRNSYHLYPFLYMPERCGGIARDVFQKALAAEGIPCGTGYRCLYRQKVFASAYMKRMTGSGIAYGEMRLENAERADAEGLWFPQNVLLGTRKDMEDIAEAMMKISRDADELR
jgi:dTDP-4-amino-4,6-dideoxygalactose transaminase